MHGLFSLALRGNFLHGELTCFNASLNAFVRCLMVPLGVTKDTVYDVVCTCICLVVYSKLVIHFFPPHTETQFSDKRTRIVQNG